MSVASHRSSVSAPASHLTTDTVCVTARAASVVTQPNVATDDLGVPGQGRFCKVLLYMIILLSYVPIGTCLGWTMVAFAVAYGMATTCVNSSCPRRASQLCKYPRRASRRCMYPLWASLLLYLAICSRAPSGDIVTLLDQLNIVENVDGCGIFHEIQVQVWLPADRVGWRLFQSLPVCVSTYLCV
jgi:hypothetical protein